MIKNVHPAHSPRHHSALKIITRSQKFWFLGVLGFVAIAAVVNWQFVLLVFVVLLTSLYLLDVLANFFIVFRGFKRETEIKFSQAELDNLKPGKLPIYTIFCPLYKEWEVLPQFASAISQLNYPKNKLQVMLLLEDDDRETINQALALNLPEYFEIIVVPHSLPKTKPKAMNYGLQFAKGEYLVVYDAEDVPDKDQLKKAILAFGKAKEGTVCIQAKLNFYNPRQNLLTRIFTAEYSLWFDLVLTGLQSLDAPIPLGGTSNHFRTKDIHLLNGWDPFNVTEDCDLGLRLAKKGYYTAIMDATTYEEANSDLKNWYRQRSRWIKGYIQTYLVHSRNPSEFLQKGRAHHLFFFQLVVGGKIFSIFVNPFLWLMTIVYFAFRSTVGNVIDSFFPTPILYMGVFCLAFGNLMYLYAYMVGCAKRGYFDLIKYAYLVPAYWLFMSVAAWQALYEIIIKPHYWAKTLHGLHLGVKTQRQLALDAKVL